MNSCSCSAAEVICLGLAKTIQFIGVTVYNTVFLVGKLPYVICTVIFGVYIRFWPTLDMLLDHSRCFIWTLLLFHDRSLSHALYRCWLSFALLWLLPSKGGCAATLCTDLPSATLAFWHFYDQHLLNSFHQVIWLACESNDGKRFLYAHLAYSTQPTTLSHQRLKSIPLTILKFCSPPLNVLHLDCSSDSVANWTVSRSYRYTALAFSCPQPPL